MSLIAQFIGETLTGYIGQYYTNELCYWRCIWNGNFLPYYINIIIL